MVRYKLAIGLNLSLFTRLQAFGAAVHLLNTQYRMHPAISEFPSTTFYDGRLINGILPSDRQVPKGFCFPKKDKPVVFVSMPDWCSERTRGSSKLNEHEASEATNIVKDLLQVNDVTLQQIGLVTPYKEQVMKLKEKFRGLAMNDIAVRTVDGFQGQERYVIVFSAVSCNEHRFTGFLDDPRRLNVLLTRAAARRALIIVRNSTTLRESECWCKWLDWANESRLVCDATNLPSGKIRHYLSRGISQRCRRLTVITIYPCHLQLLGLLLVVSSAVAVFLPTVTSSCSRSHDFLIYNIRRGAELAPFC